MEENALITEEEIKDVAGRLRAFLEDEKIEGIGDLEKKISQPYSVQQGHIINIEVRPSNFFSIDFTISYITSNKGIPIEVRINPGMNYSRIIVKTELRLEDYNPFTYDEFGNVMQEKTMDGCSISELKKELKFLGY
jgi:hypothetical protein